MWIAIVLTVIVIGLLHWALNGSFGFWKNRNVPHPKPKPLVGNIGETLLFKKHMGLIYHDMYNDFKDCSWFGLYKLRTPSIMIRSAELLKDIMIKDFPSFHDNDFDIDENIDPLFSRNPFILKGNKWKVVRGYITGAITTGKIKNMFMYIKNVSQDLVNYLNIRIDKNDAKEIDAKDLSARFTTDVVAACAFGLDGNSFEDPNAVFKKMGENLFRPEGLAKFKTMLIFIFPSFARLISASVVSKEIEQWFVGTLKETIKYRKDNKIERNDYLDIMLSLKEKPGEYAFTDMDVMAQSMTFYGDGMETSATALSFALYEIARHPEIQEKLRKEIDKVLKEHKGEISYEAVQEMSYLDMVISESLRLYPPALVLTKRCTKQFTLPSPYEDGTGPEVVIEPGMPVFISIYSIHRDSRYYPDPEKFIPERFTEEEKKSRPKCTYIPFGEGPRQCLGFRFALIQVKAAIAAIISNFEIEINSNTLPGMELDPTAFIMTKKGGILLDFKKRAV